MKIHAGMGYRKYGTLKQHGKQKTTRCRINKQKMHNILTTEIMTTHQQDMNDGSKYLNAENQNG